MNSTFCNLISSFLQDTEINSDSLAFCNSLASLPNRLFYFHFAYRGCIPSCEKNLNYTLERICEQGHMGALSAFMTWFSSNPFVDTFSALQTAIYANKIKVVRALLQRPPHVLPGTRCKREAEKRACLCFAAEFNRTALFQELIKEPIIYSEQELELCYEYAFEHGNIDMIRSLDKSKDYFFLKMVEAGERNLFCYLDEKFDLKNHEPALLMKLTNYAQKLEKYECFFPYKTFSKSEHCSIVQQMCKTFEKPTSSTDWNIDGHCIELIIRTFFFQLEEGKINRVTFLLDHFQSVIEINVRKYEWKTYLEKELKNKSAHYKTMQEFFYYR